MMKTNQSFGESVLVKLETMSLERMISLSEKGRKTFLIFFPVIFAV